MNLQIIKWLLLASLVFILTSCSNSIINKEFQSTEKETEEKGLNDNQNSTSLVRVLEQNLSFKINNDMQQETAFLKYNDNQNFSMYVLPDYQLEAAEPTKDRLYFADNDAISMRIEFLSDDVDWKLLKESTNDQLYSVYKVIPIETSLESVYLKDSAIHEVYKGNEIVTTYFINHPDMKLKLTMNTKKDEDHRDAFFQMAKTIVKENQMNNR
jgi:hypothetical protein